MKTTFIYALIDPRDNQIRYIGKSNNPHKRFYEHLSDKSITHKTSWIKSVIKSNNVPELLILDEVELESWDFWELFYYNYYKSLGFRLTNMCECGIGTTNVHPDTIKKRVKTLKENIRSGKTVFYGKPILKIDINTGEIVEEYLTAGEAAKKNNMRKQRMDELLYGSAWKQGGRIKRIQQNGFRYIKRQDYDPNKDYKTTARRSKEVQQLDLEGNLIKVFNRIKDASEELNIPSPQIVACARGFQKTCKGFIFKYPETILK